MKTSQNLVSESCTTKRYMFDIGSSTLKLKGKEVDVCNNKVGSKVLSDVLHLNLQNCIDSSDEKNHLPKECIDSSFAKLEFFLANLGLNCFASSCYAIVTQWARNIDNAVDFTSKVESLGIKVREVSQFEEGALGYNAVFKNDDELVENGAVVWDIGGGSSQIAFSDDENNIDIFSFPWGVHSFLNYYHREKTQKSLGDLDSTEATDAITDLKNKIIENDLYQKLKGFDTSNVFAIGRIFNFALGKDLNYPSEVHKDKIWEDLEYFSTHTLEEVLENYNNLPSEFVEQTQVMLIFIYAFMDTFGWESVSVKDVSINDHLLLLGDEYWNECNNGYGLEGDGCYSYYDEL